MGIFDFLNNKKKEKARQEQLRLQEEKRRAEEQRRLAAVSYTHLRAHETEAEKNNDDWQSVVSKKNNKGVKNRSCLISNLILPVISVMKMVNL